MKYGFRCKTCGHLDCCEVAGEREHPGACRVCGAGVSFHPRTGVKEHHADNWEVLADSPPSRLAELGLTADQVAKHDFAVFLKGAEVLLGREPKVVHVTASDSIGAKDKA